MPFDASLKPSICAWHMHSVPPSEVAGIKTVERATRSLEEFETRAVARLQMIAANFAQRQKAINVSGNMEISSEQDESEKDQEAHTNGDEHEGTKGLPTSDDEDKDKWINEWMCLNNIAKDARLRAKL